MQMQAAKINPGISFTTYESFRTTQGTSALIDSLTVEGATLHDANLAALTTNDLEHLAQLSQQLQMSPGTESDDNMMELHGKASPDVLQPEIGAQEVEIETEQSPQSPEEILPDIKIKTVPPLRPLTIAPKPPKVPIAIKSGGQQLLLLQGNGTAQPVKIVSSQGQGLSLANLPLTKTLTLRPGTKVIPSGSVSVLQPKQLLMKKVTQPTKLIGEKSIVIADKLETQLKATHANLLQSPPKTITMAQAQQFGLLPGGKLIPQISGKQAIMVNKSQTKAFKILPQGKTHTKILPAPQAAPTAKLAQRVILKQSNTNMPIITSGQVIQVSGNSPFVTGQLHQINIPGKGIQYIKIVTAPSTQESQVSATETTTRQLIQTSETKIPITTVTTTTGTTKVANVVLAESSVTTNMAPKSIKTASVTRTNTVLPTSGQLVVLPTTYLQQSTTPKIAIPARPSTTKTLPVPDITNNPIDGNLESNGMRPRKPCNCTKSQCLKLYCDCFANGEFCYLCNCMNCYNNLDNEEHRQRAIKSCLERNPNAFRPKIGKAKDTGDTAVRKHTKGCNCKRSGCLKNYCECYEAKIACSSNCKCIGCRNLEDSLDKKSPTQVSLNIPIPVSPPLMSKLTTTTTARNSILQFRPRKHFNNRHAFSFITDDVIEATSQCLLTMSDNAESSEQDEELTKRQIIEEFGRCLMEIIECSINRNISSPVS
ncbi:protein lin-54 homolog isoform X3 [Photinus pyralis]|uniref:protein lin-54 homolog isoform X3 n=1 Tax=Photinus pyralis TaxID=7054 RepID=UPI001267357C|nr:protein lin-54 homolog isoform X3 [Photinus pyralis]